MTVGVEIHLLTRDLILGARILRVALGSDHAGYHLKEELMKLLADRGVEYHDVGTCSLESVDYPDFALKVAELIQAGAYDRGIICCGTGIGVAITANKVPGIRAATCHDTFSAQACREHNDTNILTLGERVVGPGLACKIVEIWLDTPFAGGRHQRRLDKITAVEQKYSRFR